MAAAFVSTQPDTGGPHVAGTNDEEDATRIESGGHEVLAVPHPELHPIRRGRGRQAGSREPCVFLN